MAEKMALLRLRFKKQQFEITKIVIEFAIAHRKCGQV